MAHGHGCLQEPALILQADAGLKVIGLDRIKMIPSDQHPRTAHHSTLVTPELAGIFC